ncbi:hypothetical protein [Calothrix sp. UHCC 0171]|uniref:hypothetical protein n=1 Tax=Calothrix sp. UHCC 0171 TaxID=3110245 RepID=UPI002B1F7BBB|nr:hypothetical protein [Calothrix sp. UHCC 0171]MEA5569518.1 hypothetical protein [Calothrix sp. UHCC 0171]
MRRIYHPVKTCVLISILGLSGCGNAGQAADCQKYWQAIAKSAQTPSEIPKTQIKTKESTVKAINAIAKLQDDIGQDVGDLKFQEAKSQELQKRHLEASNALSQTFRDRAKAIASLPGNPSEVELGKVPPEIKLRQSDAFKKWTQSGDDWLQYCQAYAP